MSPIVKEIVVPELDMKNVDEFSPKDGKTVEQKEILKKIEEIKSPASIVFSSKTSQRRASYEESYEINLKNAKFEESSFFYKHKKSKNSIK